MTVYRLPDDAIAFPPPSEADEDGLLAIGGDLRPERVAAAYAQGIFPWPHEGLPLLWFSPDPRMVMRPSELHVPRRLERTIRGGGFELRLDTAFRAVMEACASVPRRDEPGTWITPQMIESYGALHEAGLAHSAEIYREGRLVGGIYGISIGRMFCGESMFFRERDASKLALVGLVRQLGRWDFDLVDAQLPTEHLASLGFAPVPRADFLRRLRAAVSQPTRLGPWTLEGGP